MNPSKSACVGSVCLALALVVFGSSAPAETQQAGKSYRIGFLTPFAVPPTESRFSPEYKIFEETLRERGYVVGQNLSIEYRTSEGHDERLPGLVEELLRLKVDVLMTLGTSPTRAAQQATKITPIVMVTVLDPVSAGFVSSLSHPGANITGSSELAEELVAKRLELIKELLPKAALVAVLWDPTHPTNALDLRRTEVAARTLGLRVRGVGAHDLSEIEKAFVDMRRWHPNALVVLTSGLAILHAPRIVDLANRSKLPTIYGASQVITSGALLGYGPDLLDQSRHAALFVDAILKGAKPADLPVRQPTKFRLGINLSTAKALGLTIPQSLVLRADDIIE
ncbi:MAG TPA: ABC transporter substrate-binding protein [Burkholderiales bacterium]|nr:ABC transporter substrate-binding protein [Burkholderiales bacterium]